MSLQNTVPCREEQLAAQLRELYQSYGYLQYKMSKFESYELYSRNRDFLVSDHIVTFQDRSGKLMALKPDVTLSIVKNAVEGQSTGEKVYYNENVYRTAKGTGKIREIMQMGLECIGELDSFCMCEVMTLAARSLALISEDHLLAVSHMGFLKGLLEYVAEDPADRKFLLECIAGKNAHSLQARLADMGVSAEMQDRMTALLSLYGPMAETLPQLKQLSVNEETASACRQLEEILLLLAETGVTQKLVLDFSIVNDMSYYNGVTFQGFVAGIPTGVLSGGRYDNLLKKFGSSMSAVGFAVYLDLLEQFEASPDYDVDVLFLYDDGTDKRALLQEVSRRIKAGERVRTARETDKRLKYRELKDLRERRAK